jgi:hypothetical protein
MTAQLIKTVEYFMIKGVDAVTASALADPDLLPRFQVGDKVLVAAIIGEVGQGPFKVSFTQDLETKERRVAAGHSQWLGIVKEVDGMTLEFDTVEKTWVAPGNISPIAKDHPLKLSGVLLTKIS